MVVVLVVPIEEAGGRSFWRPRCSRSAGGSCGWYLRVLKWLSENGLSLEVCGRLCERVTPRSASSRAVALAFIGPPRSACKVSWPGGTLCLAMASSNSGLNSSGALRIGDTPADHAAAEDVEDDVEIEVTPFGWPHQLGDVPGPDLIRTFRQQLGLPVDGMAQLLAPFADFAVSGRGCGTWCGSSSGRRLHRAGWRRSRPVPGRRSAARAADPAPPAVAGRSTPAPASASDGGSPAARPDGRARRCTLARETPSAAQAAAVMPLVRRECHDRVRQGSSPFGASGMPSSSATFFWRSMMASARFRRSARRALSR